MTQHALRLSRYTTTFVSRTALAAILVALSSAVALGDGPPQIVKIEEDWELVVATPDVDSVAPQVTCAISPTGDCDGIHATFEVNSQSLASYSAGGLQLQIWNGETALAASRHPEHNVLSTANETITWTTRMEIADGQLTFSIRDGDSQAWGQFGGQGFLRHSWATSLTNLNDYRMATSVESSGVGYAGNRVHSLTLKRLRATTANGDEFEETTNAVVHELDQ